MFARARVCRPLSRKTLFIYYYLTSSAVTPLYFGLWNFPHCSGHVIHQQTVIMLIINRVLVLLFVLLFNCWKLMLPWRLCRVSQSLKQWHWIADWHHHELVDGNRNRDEIILSHFSIFSTSFKGLFSIIDFPLQTSKASFRIEAVKMRLLRRMVKNVWAERKINKGILENRGTKKSYSNDGEEEKNTFWPHDKANNFIRNILEGEILGKSGRWGLR